MRSSEEAEFAEKIRKLTAMLPVLVYHTYDSRRSPAGFPDLVIVGQRVIYRELKTQAGRLSPAQKKWVAALAEAGQDVSIWRPADIGSGRIWAELRQLAGGAGRG